MTANNKVRASLSPEELSALSQQPATGEPVDDSPIARVQLAGSLNPGSVSDAEPIAEVLVDPEWDDGASAVSIDLTPARLVFIQAALEAHRPTIEASIRKAEHEASHPTGLNPAIEQLESLVLHAKTTKARNEDLIAQIVSAIHLS
jgi:hypothetical protein